MNKLIVVLAMVCVLVCPVWGQKSALKVQNECVVTLTLQDESLATALIHLVSQCDVKFLFNNDRIPLQEKVTLNVKNKPLSFVLDYLTEQLPIAYVSTAKNQIILKKKSIDQTIRGQVINQKTLIPISGATIQVLGADPARGAVSDASGNFRIEGVSLGRKIIEVKHVGFKSMSTSNVLVGAVKEVILHFELEESIVKMDEVVVTSSAYHSKPVNQWATVSSRSFTAEETIRFPVGLGDPGRLVSSFPGVVAGADGTNEVIIRGNSPQGMQWRIEGMEIPGPNHFSEEGATSGTISMISANAIGRSDFFTGAFPAHYGNANSGILDIRLRNGNDEKVEHIIQLGLLGLDLASEGPISQKNKSSYLINYRQSTLGLLDAVTNVLDENDEDDFQDITFKLNFPTTDKGTFSLFGLGGLSSTREFTNGSPSGEIVYDVGVVGLSHQINPSENVNIKTQLGLSGTSTVDDFRERLSDDEFHTLNTSLRRSYLHFSSTIGKDFSARNYTEAGVIFRRLGFNFFQNRQYPLNQPQFQNLTFFDEKGSSHTLQAYLSTKHRISENFTLIGGAHLFHFRLNNEWNFEPRAGFIWKVHTKHIISGGFGHHSRLAALQYYLANDFLGDGTPVQRNRYLKSPKSRHYVLGYEQSINRSTSTKVEAYYQDLYDIPELATPDLGFYSIILSPDGFVNEALVNTGKGENYGVELTLEKSFSKGHFFLVNGTVYEAKYTNRDGIRRNSVYNGNYAFNFIGGKEWIIGRKQNNAIAFNLKAAFAGNRRFIPTQVIGGDLIPNYDQAYKERLPDYSRIDIQLNYRVNNPKTAIEYRIGIQNLLSRINADQQYVDYNLTRNEAVGSFQTQQRGNQLGTFPFISFRVEF